MRNRSIYKLLLRNLSYGFSYGKYKYTAFFTIFAFLALMESIQIKPFGSNSVGTFFSLLKDNGYIFQLSDYRIPFYWNFTQFFVLFLIGDFLFQDTENNQLYLLLRCRSKLDYILSIIYWVVIQNILIFSGLFLVIYLVSSCLVGDFSISSTAYFNDHIASLMEMKATPEQLLIRIFFGYLLTSILLSSILLIGTQFFSPILTFFGVITISVISTFSDLKWLPAIHSMILKTDLFNLEHNLSFQFSIIYCIVFYSVITVLTILLFRKKDIF